MSRALALVLVLGACAEVTPGASVINPHCVIFCWNSESPVNVNGDATAPPTVVSAPLPPAAPPPARATPRAR